MGFGNVRRRPTRRVDHRAAGRLLAACRSVQRCLWNRRVTERLLIGDEVIRQLDRVWRELRLRARRLGRRVGRRRLVHHGRPDSGGRGRPRTDGVIGDVPFAEPISPHMMAARTSSVPRRCVGVFNRFALTVSSSIGCSSQAAESRRLRSKLSYLFVRTAIGKS